jgi:hypothetical protein
MSSEVSNERIDIIQSILIHIDRIIGSEEISISLCLRKLFGRKQIPSQLVSTLIQHANITNLKEACDLVLMHLSKISTNISCLLSIKVVSTTIYLLQLVLESTSVVGENECLLMGVSLIKALQKAMMSAMELRSPKGSININEISQNEPHAPTLGAFFLGAMLRGVNPYVISIPCILSPLWKCLCDLISKIPNLPYEWLKPIILAMMAYLKDAHGCYLKSAASIVEQSLSSRESHEHVFQCKVLSFLITRLASIFTMFSKRCEQEDDLSIHSDIISLLLNSWGVVNTLHSSCSEMIHQEILQGCKLVQNKVDYCIAKTMFTNDQLNLKSLKALFAIQIKDSQNFESRCTSLGMFAILKLILQMAFVDADTAEPHLLVAEQLLFVYLPKFGDSINFTKESSIHPSCLSSPVKAAMCLTSTKGLQIRLLLLKWLARAIHPVSREAIVTITHCYCEAQRLSQATKRVSTKSESCSTNTAMITLLSQVFFDQRTSTHHRQNVSSVIRRLLNSPNCAKLTQNLLLPHIMSFIKVIIHRKSGAKVMRAEETLLTQADWICILNIVERVNFEPDETLRCDISRLFDQMHSLEKKATQVKPYHIGIYTPLDVAVLISGASIHFVSKALEWFIVQTNLESSESRMTKQESILAYSMIKGLVRASRKSIKQIDTALVAKLLEWAVAQIHMLCSQQQDEGAFIMAIATGDALGVVGATVTSTTALESLNQFALCFRSLFELSNWPITAVTITNLLHFAESIPRSQKEILTRCLPVEMQGLFRSRLEGTVYRISSIGEERDSKKDQIFCNNAIMQLIPHTPYRLTPFAETQCFLLTNESLVAYQSSLKDAKQNFLMLFVKEGQSSDDMKVKPMENLEMQNLQFHQISRFRVLQDGKGCMIYLS